MKISRTSTKSEKFEPKRQFAQKKCSERMKLRDGCLERSRTDLHLTSTGKGHFYHQSLQPFPPANFGKFRKIGNLVFRQL